MNKLPRQTQRTGWWMHGQLPGMFHISKMELRHISEYNIKTTDYIEKESQKFRSNIEDYIKSHKLDDEQEVGFTESVSEEYSMLHSFFPVVLRYSILVSSCSLLESTLTNICKHLDSSSKFTVSKEWKDISINHGALNRIKIFLNNNFKISIGESTQWSSIKDIYEIRNCITHANGDISLMKDPEKTKTIIKKQAKNGVSLSEFNIIQINDKFLNYSNQLLVYFLSELESACKENDILGPPHWP